jgi:hypothetical protein
MKLLLSSLIFLFLLPLTAASQEYTIKGSVADTTLNVTLINTAVSVLNAKDSTLVTFTRAGQNGLFTLGKLPEGRFILLVTYPDYADYVEQFSLDSANPAHDFGKLSMMPKARLLEEVMIKGEVTAIKIKGDTTEFNARAFVTQPNAKVEDLLKQLPGIQVDKDGKITAQGQTVQKVLVDGEEFFGDDPTLVTKNLRADMVDKVQLFDKKSDQATFTGIDDGEKTKTLNIQLKEDSKKGYFGKANGGKGGDDFYQGELMFNSFKAKRKLAAYGTAANTGKTGLSWNDADKYGSGNTVMTEDGSMYISSDYEGERYYGEGIPLSRSGGAHYDTKWKEDKYSINANYKVNSLEINGVKNTLSQNNLPSGIINTNSDQTSYSKAFNQKADITYQIRIDTSTNLKVVASGTLKSSDSRSGFNSLGQRGASGTRINTSQRNLSNNGNQENFNINALLTRKLNKPGRTFSMNVSESMNSSSSDGFLNSANAYYDVDGNYDSTQYVDQLKKNEGKSSTLSANITYTEPLSKEWSIIFNYGLGITNSSSDRRSYNQSAPGEYNLLDNQYSNNFDLNQLTNQGGAVFNFRKNKTIFNFGTKATAVRFDQTDLFNNQKYDRNFTNWLPQASFQYRPSTQKSFRLGYNGSTSQPSISQIQPIKVNDDPMNLILGNADLDPSFSHRFNASYYSYKVITSQSISMSGSFSFTDNAIVSERTTNTLGKSTSRSVNLDGRSPVNYSAYFSTDRKIKGLNFSVGINLNTNGSRSYNYVNSEINTTRSENYNVGLNLSKYTEKKYDIYFSFSRRFNKAESSLQKNVNNNGKGFGGYGYVNVYLPGKVQLSSDMNYTYNGKTSSFSAPFEQFIINASIAKTFMKSEGLKLSLSGNDLLNQNSGFSRYSNSNYITQNSYNTIRRYFLLSLSWDFSRMGAGTPEQAPVK